MWYSVRHTAHSLLFPSSLPWTGSISQYQADDLLGVKTFFIYGAFQLPATSSRKHRAIGRTQRRKNRPSRQQTFEIYLDSWAAWSTLPPSGLRFEIQMMASTGNSTSVHVSDTQTWEKNKKYTVRKLVDLTYTVPLSLIWVSYTYNCFF